MGTSTIKRALLIKEETIIALSAGFSLFLAAELVSHVRPETDISNEFYFSDGGVTGGVEGTLLVHGLMLRFQQQYH